MKYTKALRESKSLSQKQLAEMVGCSINTVKKWDRNTRGTAKYQQQINDIFDPCSECEFYKQETNYPFCPKCGRPIKEK